MKGLALAVFAVVLSLSFLAADQSAPFHFALLGDIPYFGGEEEQFLGMLKTISADPSLAFVVHDGDFKSGKSPCTDELFLRRQAQFQSVEHPLVYVFGDNEWTDCHREEAGKYNPVERLAKLRELFTSGSETLGKRTLPLRRQSDNPRYQKFRENVRWIYGDVIFVGLNVPGSDNNIAQKREYEERNAANVAWLQESFKFAAESGTRGVMVIIHANPKFQSLGTAPKRNPYRMLLGALEREVRAFDKPVVLVHGDTHRFRIDKPLRDSQSGQPIENFTRVETFGTPDVRWIKGTVDPHNPAVFRFEPVDQGNLSPATGVPFPVQ